MVPIESAAVERIASFSTSDLAPLLNSVQRRPRLIWVASIGSTLAVAYAVSTGSRELLGVTLLAAAAVTLVAAMLDRYRRSIKVDFRIEGLAANVAAALNGSFDDLRKCGAVWNIVSEGHTADWKRSAGATTLNDRKAISPRLERPRCVRSTTNFPKIQVGKTGLFFLPDAVLVVTESSVAALAYADLAIALRRVRFIESSTTPSDATVVDHTWQYVNKNGGPDRRFSFNKQLPICLYGEMDFQSSGGLSARIQYSVPSAGDRLAKVIELLAQLGTSAALAAPIMSYRTPRKLPTVIYLCSFIVIGAVLAGAGFLSHAPQRTEALRSVQPIPETTSSVPKQAPPMGGPFIRGTKQTPKIQRVEPSSPATGAPMSINPIDIESATTPAPLPRPRPK